MRVAFFTMIIIFSSRAATAPPPPLVPAQKPKPVPSLFQLCLNYLKQEQLKGVDRLSAKIRKIIPELPHDATVTQLVNGLKALYPLTYRAPNVLKLSLERTTFGCKLPQDLDMAKRIPQANAVLKLLETTPALHNYLAQLARAIKDHIIASPTRDPCAYFNILLSTIPSLLHQFVRSKTQQCLAWRLKTLPLKDKHIVNYAPQSVRKLIQTHDYLVVELTNGVEYIPVNNTAPPRSFIVPLGFQSSKTCNASGNLFCYGLGPANQVALIHPFKPRDYKLFVVPSDPKCVNSIECVAFSDPPTLMAVAQENGMVEILDTNTFARYAQLDKRRNSFTTTPITTMAFSPTKDALLMGHKNGAWQLWKNKPWHFIHCFTQFGQGNKTKQIEFTADGKRAFVRQKKTSCIDSIDIEKEDWDNCQIEHADLQCFALSAQQPLIATGGPGLIRIWDSQTAECLQKLGCLDMPISALTFSPGGLHLIAGTKTGIVFRWSANDHLNHQLFAAHLERKIQEDDMTTVEALFETDDYKKMLVPQKARVALQFKERKK